jgi:hypothetical protein
LSGRIFFGDIIDPEEDSFTNSLSGDKKAYSVFTGHVMKIWIGWNPYLALARLQRLQNINANCACPAMDGIATPAR